MKLTPIQFYPIPFLNPFWQTHTHIKVDIWVDFNLSPSRYISLRVATQLSVLNLHKSEVRASHTFCAFHEWAEREVKQYSSINPRDPALLPHDIFASHIIVLLQYIICNTWVSSSMLTHLTVVATHLLNLSPTIKTDERWMYATCWILYLSRLWNYYNHTLKQSGKPVRWSWTALCIYSHG